MGAALLDLDEPWRVIARGHDYLLSPQVDYEQVGDVPNVVFPSATLIDAATDRLTVYYGAADTVTGIAHGHLSEILASLRRASRRRRTREPGRRSPLAPAGIVRRGGRRTLDQRRPDDRLHEPVARELEPVEQHREGEATHAQLVDRHGRELGRDEPGEVDVVVADHRHVPWHGQAGALGGPDDLDGDRVVGREHRRDRGVGADRLHGRGPRGLGRDVRHLDDPGLELGLGHGLLVAATALDDAGEGVRAGADERDAAMALRDQVLDRAAGTARRCR